jgi:hypothetical protein
MELQILENVDKIKSMIIDWEIQASQVKLFMNRAEKQFINILCNNYKFIEKL